MKGKWSGNPQAKVAATQICCATFVKGHLRLCEHAALAEVTQLSATHLRRPRFGSWRGDVMFDDPMWPCRVLDLGRRRLHDLARCNPDLGRRKVVATWLHPHWGRATLGGTRRWSLRASWGLVTLYVSLVTNFDHQWPLVLAGQLFSFYKFILFF